VVHQAPRPCRVQADGGRHRVDVPQRRWSSGLCAGGTRQGSFTLAVRNIADEIAKLDGMGVDTSDQTSSPRVRTVMIVDPAGNHIALAEAFDPALAK